VRSSYAERLRAALLAAGVSTARTRRIALEIDDHLRCAAAELCHRPGREAAAMAAAERDLGRIEDIVEAVRRDRRNLSLPRRRPLTVFVLLPIPVLLAMAALFGIGGHLVVESVRAAAGDATGRLLTAWSSHLLLLIADYGLAVTAIAGFAQIARRSGCPLAWPLVSGLLILAARTVIVADLALDPGAAPSEPWRLTVGAALPADPRAWGWLIARPVLLVTAVALPIVLCSSPRTGGSPMPAAGPSATDPSVTDPSVTDPSVTDPWSP